MKNENSRASLWTLAVLGATVLLQGRTSAQSAWTQPEGSTFLQLSLQRVGPYDTLFRSGSDFDTGREITETTLETYAEYGLSDGLTLIGLLPVRYLEAGGRESDATIQPVTIDSGNETALGNILVGARKRLASGNYDVAAQLGVEVPTGSLDHSTGLNSGLDAFTFLPSISVGRGFEKSYVQGYAGLGLRTDDYSHDWRVGLESGYRFDRFLLAGTLDAVSVFSSGDVRDDSRNRQTGLYVDGQEYVSFGAKGLYDVSEGFGIQGAVRGAFSGRDVAKSPFVSIGVYFNW